MRTLKTYYWRWMDNLSKSQRSLRQPCKKKYGERVFDIGIVQNCLGFSKRGSLVKEKIAGIELEYDYATDIGEALFYNGEFEESEIKFFRKVLSEYTDPVVLDIGANIGLHTLRWAKARPDTKVYAFEPTPATVKMLQSNIARNGIASRVTVVPMALSDYCGKATFYETDDNAYNSLKNTKRKSLICTCEVPVTTIDDFVKSNNVGNISLIKIDVEGLETQVISGGLDTLKGMKPDLFVEIYGGHNSNSDPEATVKLICSLGYNAFVLKEGKALPYIKHSDQNYNYYFTEKHISDPDDLLWSLEGRPITDKIESICVIGAHRYQEKDLLDRIFPRLKHIYLFEPLPELAPYLKRIAESDTRIQFFPFAISDVDGVAEFHITNHEAASSSLLSFGKHQEIFPHVQVVDTIQVQTRTLESVISEYNLAEPEMLFIDVQGAEFKVLSSLSPSFCSRLSIVYTEASTEEVYAGAKTLEDIDTMLAPHFVNIGFLALDKLCPTHGNTLLVNSDSLNKI